MSPPATIAINTARNACQRMNLPWAARAAAASRITSPGIGTGTPADLTRMMTKIAARPYSSRNASNPPKAIPPRHDRGRRGPRRAAVPLSVRAASRDGSARARARTVLASARALGREEGDQRVQLVRAQRGAVGGHVQPAVQDAPGELVRREAAAN